jgi:purine-binding chemotaxis protein CheW
MSSKTTEVISQVVNATSDREGKYLTFKLGAEVYGLEILKVREIMGLMAITAVPRTPSYVRGVINLRGKVIPVVDLRTKFGMESVEDTEETCIIVVDVGALGMGITVDAVSEVIEIAGCDIEDAPTFGKGVNTDFILGMGKANKKVTMLLDIRQVLTNEESTDLSASLNTAEAKKEEITA